MKRNKLKHVEVEKKTMTNCPKERSNGQKNMQEYEQREKERYEDTILNIYQKDKSREVENIT